METTFYILRIVAMAITVLTSLFFAYSLSTVAAEILPSVHTLFNRKPFSCRPCLTFWLAWLFVTLNSIAFSSWELLVAGLFIALAVFFIVYRSDKKMVIE